MDPLEYMLMTYLHEDFYEVHGSDRQAIEAFIRSDPHLVQPALIRLEALLEGADEQDLAAYAEQVHFNLVPDEADGSYAGWFKSIADQLRKGAPDAN